MKLFFQREPGDAEIRSFIAEQKDRPFSYLQIGATGSEELPNGYVVDRNRSRLGQGKQTFERAVEGLRNWCPFEIPWLRLFSAGQAPAEGLTVAILIRHRFAWSLNSCRVVYTFDDSQGAARRFGFAYGTLHAHGERGEERFEVSWDRKSEEVEYKLLAFSRPRHWLARLGHPLARRLQRRFVRDSQVAMRRAVARDRLLTKDPGVRRPGEQSPF